ncbi:MAG: phosphopantetheine-binding protein [Myxococcota bacterium]|jgi:acyl carrier protein|nr:phosphopantetheine-binding protein [Myxococcota bacterium]
MPSRDEILETLRTIIVETRGVDESEVVPEANLFNDLGLESIDFLEISFRMEESFGFPFPTDQLGELMGGVTEDSTREQIETVLDQLKAEFYIPVVKDKLDGLDPYEPNKLRDGVLALFTVNALADFVEAKSA